MSNFFLGAIIAIILTFGASFFSGACSYDPSGFVLFVLGYLIILLTACVQDNGLGI